MIKIKRSFLLLLILVLSNSVPLQASVWGWFKRLFAIRTSLFKREKIKVDFIENFKKKQKQPQQHKRSWWEKFKRRISWNNKEDLKESGKDLKKHVYTENNKVEQHVNRQIKIVGNKVKSVKQNVKKAQEEVSKIKKNIKTKSKKYTDQQEKFKKEQEEISKKRQEADDKNQKELQQKVAGFEKSTKQQIEQKQKEIKELKNLLSGKNGLQTQVQTSFNKLQKKFEKTHQENAKCTENIKQKVKEASNAMQQVEQSSRKTSKSLESLKFKLLRAQQKIQNERKNSKYLIQLIFGMNQKFNLAMQIWILKSNGCLSIKQLGEMQNQYKALLGSMKLMEQQRQIELASSANGSLILFPNDSQNNLPVIDKAILHNYLSGILKINRLSLSKIEKQFNVPLSVFVACNNFLPNQNKKDFSSLIQFGIPNNRMLAITDGT